MRYHEKQSIMKIEAVIFDMDGVLVDSEGLWKIAEKEVFSSLGVVVTEKLSHKTQSMTTDQVTQFWFERYPWEGTSHQEVEQMVVDRVIELIQNENCAIKGIKSFIEKLRSEGLKVGLATNSPFKIIAPVLKKSGISHLFDAISSAEFEKQGKPAPDIYLTTAKKLSVNPKHCVAIEDSNSGIQAAHAAGMKAVAFTNNKKNGHHYIVDLIIDDFEVETLPLLEKNKV